MQNVAEGEIQEAGKPIRTFPQCPLIRFDAKRPVILREFIKMIGDEIDDISDGDVEKWLKNFKTEALLTPYPCISRQKVTYFILHRIYQ